MWPSLPHTLHAAFAVGVVRRSKPCTTNMPGKCTWCQAHTWSSLPTNAPTHQEEQTRLPQHTHGISNTCNNNEHESCPCMEQRTFRPRLSLAPDPAGTLKKRLLSTPVLSDDIRGTWAGLSAGQLPPAIKHCVSFFHSTAHCTPGHQNLYAPTKKFAWPACQVSDLDVGCVALARP